MAGLEIDDRDAIAQRGAVCGERRAARDDRSKARLVQDGEVAIDRVLGV